MAFRHWRRGFQGTARNPTAMCRPGNHFQAGPRIEGCGGRGVTHRECIGSEISRLARIEGCGGRGVTPEATRSASAGMSPLASRDVARRE
jgi:hypothetical protein